MNKQEFVDKFAKDLGTTKKFAEQAVNAFWGIVEEVLKKGGKLQFVNEGTFSVAKRAARKGVNPRTGKPITIPAKKVVKFTPGKKLKEAVK
ncbi:MAG: HU family DNA-binding protein [Coprothermobacterota bacterium]|jgi:DNA-binding protein HU-beta|nr:HU family DNA-binding protein [Caldisericota bacterium]MDI6869372.1 HU family DNA-binding protein [Coprothermobacterota bacterium]